MQDSQESSQENNPNSQPGPPLSQGSYNEAAEDSQEMTRASLPEDLECAASLRSPPNAEWVGDLGNGRLANPTMSSLPAEDRSRPSAAAGLGTSPGLPVVMEEPDAAPLEPLSQRLRAWRRGGPREALPKHTCQCGLDFSACGACGRGWAQVAGGGQKALPPNSPPTTPARRRRRNEMEAPSSVQTPLGKRIRGMPLPAPPARTVPDVSKEDWERRLQKRRAAIAAIKKMPEYTACAEGRLSGAIGDEEVPLTPEPDDSTVSKRQWEARVMQWRGILKRMALPPCIDLDSES